MKKVLIYRNGLVGDSIVAIPTLRAIIDKFKLKECEVHFLKKKGQKITLLDFIYDEIKIKKAFEISPSKNLIYYYKKIMNFRKENYNYLFYLQGTRSNRQILRDKIFFYFCNIEKKYGLSFKNQKPKLNNKKSLEFEHESKRLYRLIFNQVIDEDYLKKNYFLKYRRNYYLEKTVNIKKNLFNIGISLFSKNLVKNWNLNYWSNLLRLIQKKIPNSYFYFFGGKEDFNKTNFFLKNNKSLKAKNICGLYSIKEDFFLISKMKYFISIDSGNAHIASILKIPTLVIMSSATLKGNWSPLNSINLNAPCDCQGKGFELCQSNQRKCILSLNPSLVLKKFIYSNDLKNFLKN